jgi:hypothetical protein
LELYMTIPGQTINSQISHATPSDCSSQAATDDFRSRHHATRAFTGDSSNPLAVFEPPVLSVPDASDLASTEKTRAALLKLGDSPRDTLALAALWDENRSSIEHEMNLHLYSASNSPLLQELLARLVWHVRFFCDEVDDPKAWVARCTNLEARRLALKLIENRQIRMAISSKNLNLTRNYWPPK